MPHPFLILFGKSIRAAAALRGGGSALPGLFVERIDPTFITTVLSQLPRGVVLISGTNGKTTTTKMVVSLLESQGLKVFTNRTGSNFTRGVAAALLSSINLKGELKADIAVLELDEAHAVKFAEVVKPTHSLFLNVMRDQLDRFGEIDATATMLSKVADATTDSIIVNREDPRLYKVAQGRSLPVHYFGLAPDLRAHFPSDDELRGGAAATAPNVPADVTLDAYQGNTASFMINGSPYTTTLAISGVYNVFNAAAALAVVSAVMKEDFDAKKSIEKLATVTPAFGRGEQLLIGGQPFEIILVKNPSGFRLALQSYPPEGVATMIAINDNYADGRDMSWLWDVDFGSLQAGGVSAVSGIRAHDMALRLQYDNITTAAIEPDLNRALRHFIADAPDTPKRLYCTYTAMLSLRKELSSITTVERIS